MSITVAYVADSPQFRRLGRELRDGDTIVVGDKMVGENAGATGSNLYVCTTGGTHPDTFYYPFRPTLGQDPYTWQGGSVWSIIQPTSWANAAPSNPPRGAYTNPRYGVAYVDCFRRSFGAVTDGALTQVFVHPGTLQPMHSLFSYTYITSSSSKTVTYFAGLPEGTSYHTKQQLGGNTAGQVYVGNWIDAEFTCTSGMQTENRQGPRGVRVTNSRAVNDGYVPVGGVAYEIIRVNAGYTAVDSTTKEYRALGQHVTHPGGSSLFSAAYSSPGYTDYDQRSVMNGCHGGISDNDFTPPPYVAKSLNMALKTYPTIYRNSAAPSGHPEFSLMFVCFPHASPGRTLLSPFFYVHNTLTGSRTVTVHFLTNSPFELDMYDTDIWLDVFYPSSTGTFALATSQNTNFGVPNCSKTQIASDAASWTTTGLSGATAFKLTVSATIQTAGVLYVRFCVASTKLTFFNTFACPHIEVT